MTGTPIGDDFNTRPPLLMVPRSARLLHVEALVYCNQHLTNGLLPKGALRRITDAEEPELEAKLLVEVGEWIDVDTGWQLDWSEQDDADEVKARQDYRAATQKRYRERKAKHDRGDHSMCDPRYCKSAVTGNASSNVTTNETPSRPVPSRPKDRDREQDADRTGADAPTGRAPQLANVTCPHGREGGPLYKDDGHVRCPGCDLVAPVKHSFADWMRSVRPERGNGWLVDVINNASDEDCSLTESVCTPLYLQMGGKHTADNDPVDEDLWAFLCAYVLLGLAENPNARPTTRRTA
jgi:hypothetical protein